MEEAEANQNVWVVAELRLIRKVIEKEDVCDTICERVMHLVHEKRLIGPVVWDKKHAPLQVPKREPRTLLFRHKIGQLPLIVYVCDDGHSFVHRIHHLLIRVRIKHVLAEHLDYFGLEANPQKSYCWCIPRWKTIEEFGDFGDLYPLQPRIPYKSQYKYLGLSYRMNLRREVTMETAIHKAKRIEKTLAAACRRAGALPIVKLAQMASQIFEPAVLYGLGTIRKRHATNLKELDKIQARVLKVACGLSN